MHSACYLALTHNIQEPPPLLIRSRKILKFQTWKTYKVTLPSRCLTLQIWSCIISNLTVSAADRHLRNFTSIRAKSNASMILLLLFAPLANLLTTAHLRNHYLLQFVITRAVNKIISNKFNNKYLTSLHNYKNALGWIQKNDCV